MPTKYLDEEGLSHVVDLAKKKFADKKELWNWQKTEKAPLVQCSPVPDSPLKTTAYFSCTEVPPESGDKGPDNPSTIVGVQSIQVTRSGKNILPLRDSSRTINEIEFTLLSDGSYEIVGTYNGSGNCHYDLAINYTFLLKANTTYTASFACTNPNAGFRFQGWDNTETFVFSVLCNQTYTIPSADSDRFINIRITLMSDCGEVDTIVFPQLEIGDVATEFEKPVSNAYSIDLGNTYYGGHLDLSTGTLIVEYKKMVLDGTLNGNAIQWFISDVYQNETSIGAYIPDENMINSYGISIKHIDNSLVCCDKFPIHFVDSNSDYFRNGEESVYKANFNIRSFFIRINNDKLASYGYVYGTTTAVELVGIINNYLHDNPITIIYVAANPDIVQLDPSVIRSLQTENEYEPQINTLYGSADFLEVGYQKFIDEYGVVHTTGNETIGGVKTFANSEINASEGTTTVVNIRNPSVTRGIPSEDGRSWTQLLFLDANGDQQDQSGRLGMFELCSPSTAREDSHEYMQFSCYRFSDSLEDRYKRSSLNVGFDINGIPYAQVSSTSEERDEPTDIVTRDYLPKSKAIPQFSDLLNWQKTNEKQLVSFNPVSESVIEPIIKFKFNESLPAEGEKDINNPSTINPVSSVKLSLSGRNLGETTAVSDESPVNGISFTVNEDDTVTVNSTEATAERYFTIKLVSVPAGTYTLSGCPSGGTNSTYFLTIFYAGQSNAIKDYGNKVTFTIDEQKTLQISICVRSGTTLSNLVFKPQLEAGTTATPFEAYSGINRIISLENAYYGGILNVESGLLTVTHHGFIPSRSYIQTATVTATTDANLWQVYLGKFSASYKPEVFNYSNNAGYGGIDYRCNYLNWDRVGNVKSFHVSNGFAFASFEGNSAEDARQNCLNFYDETVANNNPLTIVYPLATPYTVQLSPQQIKSIAALDKYTARLNIAYTDASSVQVGYQRFVDDANVVHKTGDETITGVKTFKNTASGHSTGESVTDLIVRNEAVQRGVGGEGRSYTRVIFADADGDIEETYAGRLAFWECVTPKENDTIGSHVQMGSYKYSQETTDLPEHADLRVGWDANGVQFATAPETSNERNDPADVVTRGWVESKTWNWQKTKKESIVQFNPVPDSILEPVVEFKFTETLPESGEKGPENPSIIEGISSINVGRAGKNLILGDPIPSNIANISYVVNSDGSITFNGSTLSSGDHSYLYTYNSTLNRYSFPSFMKRGETYRLSATCSQSISYILYQVYVSINGGTWNTPLCEVYGGQSKTFAIPENATGLACRYIVVVNKTVDNATFRVQLEGGSVETEYEKPVVDNYAVQLGDTYYGGSINLNTGVMTVKNYGYVFTGQETFRFHRYPSFDRWYCDAAANGIHSSEYVKCTHFVTGNNQTPGTFSMSAGVNNPAIYFNVATDEPAPTEFLAQQYANGTPVTVVTKIRDDEIFTVQLTPQQIKSLASTNKYTPRINTIYTDASSVQVGYQRYIDEEKLLKVGLDENDLLYATAPETSNTRDNASDILTRGWRITEEEIDEAFAE